MTTTVAPTTSPLDVLPPSGVSPLSRWQIIRASGQDAISFLHGQLTHDLALLPADGARLNAYCSPQGRMLANMVTWRDGEHDVMLAMPTALVEPTLKRLRMFVMRSKCTFTEESEGLSLCGVWGEAVPSALSAPWKTLREADQTWVRLSDGPQAMPRALCWAPRAPAGLEQPEDQWDALSIASAQAWLTPETSAAFVPQMLNWESLDGISFKKGCYPGQEVVARSQFRGAIKRRTERVTCAEPLQPGQAVFAQDQEVGSVVNAAPLGKGYLALVCVHTAQADGQALRAGAAGGPSLSRLGLPYALLEDI